MDRVSVRIIHQDYILANSYQMDQRRVFGGEFLEKER